MRFTLRTGILCKTIVLLKTHAYALTLYNHTSKSLPSLLCGKSSIGQNGSTVNKFILTKQTIY